MCQRRQLSSVQLQNFTNCSFCMYIMLLNLVNILKCETNYNSFIHVIPHLLFAMALFQGLFLRAFP